MRRPGDHAPADTKVRFWLTTDKGSIVLPEGEAVLGRGPECEISISDDASVSRGHAMFIVAGSTAAVRDLESSNGTFVDGERLTGSKKLFGGEVIRVGSRHYQVGVGLRPPKQFDDTKPASPKSIRAEETDVSDLTPRVDTTGMSKFLRAALGGTGPDGKVLDQDVLLPMLDMVREEIESTGTIEPRIARHACETALALSVSTRNAAWIDFAVDAYDRLEVAMPERVIDALEVAIWNVDGVNPRKLQGYADRLRAVLDPEDHAGQAARLRIEEQARAAKNRSERSKK